MAECDCLESNYVRKGIVGSNPTPSTFAPPKLARAKASFVELRRDKIRQYRHTKKSGKEVMYYVYSLKCKDGYYIGCTDDLKDRIKRHQKGQIPATVDRLPIKLVFYFAVNDKYKAFEFEKYLKSGSGRAFIERHLV